MLTGEITPLSSIPAPLPESIPEPDTTGETRALIQGKSSSREEGEQSLQPVTPIDPPPVDGTGTTTAATSTDALTLDLTTTAASSSPFIATSTEFTLDLSLTPALQIVESDVVVPTFSTTTTTEE